MTVFITYLFIIALELENTNIIVSLCLDIIGFALGSPNHPL